MAENQRIPFNFTYFAMKLLGKNLYSNPWTAVSEIVANGIDAGAENVYVLIDMRNKEKAVVEIFDDGTGMSFEDLSEKYTLIGRNKRLESDNREGKTLGRKGIGKLAALYLSPRYYLYTKTDDGKSAWCVNTQIIKDSDIPALMETTYDTGMLISKTQWDELRTGTMIHLSDVDLRKIGRERLKSLPLMLADYYLDHIISSTVSVCVIEENNDSIVFSPIKKKVNFETMFGIFDNTKLGYKDRISCLDKLKADLTIKSDNVCGSTSRKWECVKKSPDPIPQILNDPIQFNWKVKEMLLKRLCDENIIGLTTWSDIEYIFRLRNDFAHNPMHLRDGKLVLTTIRGEQTFDEQKIEEIREALTRIESDLQKLINEGEGENIIPKLMEETEKEVCLI